MIFIKSRKRKDLRGESDGGKGQNRFSKRRYQRRKNFHCKSASGARRHVFYALSNGLFHSMVGRRQLMENYWGCLSEAIIMMYHTAKLFSDMGHNVLIDGLLL